jgi:hypothetical protein
VVVVADVGELLLPHAARRAAAVSAAAAGNNFNAVRSLRGESAAIIRGKGRLCPFITEKIWAAAYLP